MEVGEVGTEDMRLNPEDIRGGNKAGSVKGVRLSAEYLMFVYSRVLV